MAPGGERFRNPLHFGENVLPYGSHEWLPCSVIPTFSKRICKQQFIGFLPHSEKHEIQCRFPLTSFLIYATIFRIRTAAYPASSCRIPAGRFFEKGDRHDCTDQG